MLRDPQHERKINKDINSPPFVLSLVEALREGFQRSARTSWTEASWIETVKVYLNHHSPQQQSPPSRQSPRAPPESLLLWPPRKGEAHRKLPLAPSSRRIEDLTRVYLWLGNCPTIRSRVGWRVGIDIVEKSTEFLVSVRVYSRRSLCHRPYTGRRSVWCTVGLVVLRYHRRATAIR
jgi:hypothetical protein